MYDIRQHAGFMKAYKVINEDLDPIDNWLDWSVFYTGMFACVSERLPLLCGWPDLAISRLSGFAQTPAGFKKRIGDTKLGQWFVGAPHFPFKQEVEFPPT